MRGFSSAPECEPGPEDLTPLETVSSESSSTRPTNELVRSKAGIVIHDPISRRLLETAMTQLELTSVTLDDADLAPATISGFEIVIAEEPHAHAIQAMLAGREEHAGEIHPALVAVHLAGYTSRDRPEATFDGVLTLPLEPAPLIAQLSLILYAHRAFARRYSSALEELHLNRRIFRSVTSGISVANASRPDLPLVYVNPAFEVMTGYALEEVLGKNCRFLQGKETDQPGVTLIREAVREHREAVAVLKNYRKDGSAFWNELSLSPIRNRDGVVTHFVGIQTDVTARVEFEAALRESEKLAAVGRLASTIAHEINNPLESVMNLLFLAQTTADPVETRRYLTVADQELRRVSLITAQSLRFYKQSTKPQPVRPSELLDSVLNMYAGQLENANVSVDRCDRTASLVVCLESEIRQVLNNLVRNAIDAMRATGGRLLLRTREGTDERSGRRGVVVAVADTGSGMSRETLKHICTAFFTTKGISGTGLGLWISTEIVGRHHGRLSVRSSQRHGATGTVFRLFLPFQGVSSPS
jgi:PAS domain S-box-containing protein